MRPKGFETAVFPPADAGSAEGMVFPKILQEKLDLRNRRKGALRTLN